MRFLLYGNNFQSKKSIHIQTLLHTLRSLQAEIYIDEAFYQFLTRELRLSFTPDGLANPDDPHADMAISLGGDGTFLRVASYVGRQNIPIVGVNTGRLGFLADISPEDIKQTFADIMQGRYQIAERRVLHVSSSPDNHPLKGCPYALNEIAVLKRDSSSMISIHTTVNGHPLTTYQADGLIISTPTGSTAYSLSVGGPIMVPQSGVFALTPVAPHSLNMRPIVVRDDWQITLDIESRSHNFLIAIDGRSESCQEGTRLTICKADYTIKIVQHTDSSFFSTLCKKMMWGADTRK